MKREINKNILTILLLLGASSLSAWEVNTHQALTRCAITDECKEDGTQRASNLQFFVENNDISKKSYYKEKYPEFPSYTYISYARSGEEAFYEDWLMDSSQHHGNYIDMIETGSILEDALYPDYENIGDGRFNNHFYDPQQNGKKLTWGYGNKLGLDYTDAVTWAIDGADLEDETDSYDRKNNYSYKKALEYYKNSFTKGSLSERATNQAKMFISLGHLLHLLQDMHVPAHVRDDAHSEYDLFEYWARNENGFMLRNGRFINENKTVKNAVKKLNIRDFTKRSQFTDARSFYVKEATFTSNNFLSFGKDAVVADIGVVFDKIHRPKKDEDTVKILYKEEKNYIGAVIQSKYYYNSLKNTVNDIISATVNPKKIAMQTNSIFSGIGDIVIKERDDNSILIDNALNLIPRAVGASEGFINYFFRGRMEAKLESKTLTITNISDTSLVASADIVTFKKNNGAFSVYYDTNSGERKLLDTICSFDNDIARGESIICEINNIKDLTKYEQETISVVFDGTIGTKRSISVTKLKKIDFPLELKNEGQWTHTVVLQWNKNDDATGYTVCKSEKRITDGAKCEENGGILLYPLASDIFEVNDGGEKYNRWRVEDGLEGGKNYYFRVNQNGKKLWSNEIGFSTKGAITFLLPQGATTSDYHIIAKKGDIISFSSASFMEYIEETERLSALRHENNISYTLWYISDVDGKSHSMPLLVDEETNIFSFTMPSSNIVPNMITNHLNRSDTFGFAFWENKTIQPSTVTLNLGTDLTLEEEKESNPIPFTISDKDNQIKTIECSTTPIGITISNTNENVTVTAPKYSDMQSFTVKCVASDDNNELASDEVVVTVTQKLKQSLPAPTNLKIQPTTKDLNVSWDAVTDADAYKICMSTSHIVDNPTCTGDNETLFAGDKNLFKVISSGLEHGKIYHFRVKAFKAGYNCLWSEEKLSSLKDIPKLPAPTNLKATSTVDSITLNWDWSYNINPTHYDMCMSKSVIPNGDSCEENGGTLFVSGVSTEKKITNGLELDTTYYFRVRGVKSGYDALWSDEVVITVTDENTDTLQNGLVAWYKFDDPSDLGKDSSINGNDGEAYGGVGSADGVIGKAGSFDGVDDYILVNQNLISSSKGTLSIWYYNDTNQENPLLGYLYDTDGNRFYYYNASSGNDRFGFNNGGYSSFIDNNIWEYSKWINLIVKYDFVSKSSIVYKNGVKIATISTNTISEMTNYSNFFIGKRFTSTEYGNEAFKGKIDDLRIYNRALSESEIKELYKRGADNIDSDHDGISDKKEQELGLNPNSNDSDGDGILDGVEVGDVDDPTDTDDDGTIDALDLDSDDDGFTDKEEVEAGTDPQDEDDYPDNGGVNLTNGLVAHYEFEEQNGAEILKDSSTNGNDGTIYSDVKFVDGVVGERAGSFDGVDDYVKINDSVLGKKGSFSLYFKSNTLDTTSQEDGFSNILSNFKPHASNAGSRLYLIQENNKLKYGIGSIQKSESIQTIDLNKWTHVYAQWKEGEYKIYVNGELKDTTTYNGYPIQEEFGFGGFINTNKDFFNGLIDNLRIYNRALNESEIKALYKLGQEDLDEGLVAHYKFDGDTQDSSGKNNHGTAHGGVDCSVAGVIGQACSFDGLDDYIEVSHNKNLNPENNQKLTWNLWVKLNLSDTEMYPLEKMGSNVNNGYDIRLDGGKVQLVMDDNTLVWDYSNKYFTDILSDKKFHMISFIFDRVHDIIFYIDGKKVLFDGDSYQVQNNNRDFSNVNVNYNGNMFIGKRHNYSDNYFFDGLIDDLRIYNRALSEEEIKALYKLGQPEEVNLIANYEFNNGFTNSITNVDDSTKWEHSQDVNIQDGYLKLINNYDHDPKRGVNITLNTLGVNKLVIEKKVKLTTRDNYTQSSTYFISNSNNQKISIEYNNYHYNNGDLSHTINIDNTEHFYIYNRWNYKDNPNNFSYKVSDLLQPIWSEWFYEKIVIDYVQKNIDYSVSKDGITFDTVSISSMTFEQDNNTTFGLSAWDWASGSEHTIDYLKIYKE